VVLAVAQVAALAVAQVVEQGVVPVAALDGVLKTRIYLLVVEQVAVRTPQCQLVGL